MTKRVAFIGHYSEQLLFETVLDTIDHDVVLLEPVAHAYSHIKRVAPDLVDRLPCGRRHGWVPAAVDAGARSGDRTHSRPHSSHDRLATATIGCSVDSAHRASSYFSSVAVN